MIGLVPLFTTTAGRISRRQWWLVVIMGWIVSLLLAGVLSIIGLSGMRIGPLATIPTLLLLWCPSIKRRHDRDNKGNDFAILAVLSVVTGAVKFYGTGAVLNGTLPSSNAVLLLIAAPSVLVGLYAIYILIQLGYMQGTVGDNGFGPDPLAGPV